MSAIKKIVCYPNLLPFEPTEQNTNIFMEAMAETSVTHVQVNHLPDLMHPEHLHQPSNVYLWFANFGPPLDVFVSSKLNYGLWPELYLERNRRTLLRFADAAKRHGIKPVLYLCEPRFVPERFFDKHPTLRGPRVDNPTCSTAPLYSLCTDMPEVLDHYREMMAKMMDLVPELSMASIFTGDSGSSFDYNPDTYAGSNGAGFNRGIPLERRVARFLTVLLEEGKRKTPDFTVNLTSGISGEDRAKIFAIAPKGVLGSVYGLYDWTGGLEEMWGYHQAMWGLPKAKWNIRNLDRVAAAKDRYDELKERFDVAAKGGREPIVHVELPTTDYSRPVRYTPHPFEVIRIMKDVVKMGGKNIALWGVISPKELVPYDVNAEALKKIIKDVKADPDKIVREIAEKWVGKKHASVLFDAWKKCDHTYIRRPLWTIGLHKEAWPAPLVPDLTILTPEEMAYYRTPGGAELERISGKGWYLAQESDERNRDYVMEELYEKQTLPVLLDVADTLAKEAAKATGEAAKVLKNQSEHVRFAYLYTRTQYNWYDAARYLIPAENPRYGRTIQQIVDDEIKVTQETIALLDGHPDRFMRLMLSDHMCHEIGMGIVGQLKQRVVVMKAHRKDKARNLSKELRKMREYLKSIKGEE